MALILQWSIKEPPPAAVDDADRITIGLVMNLDTYTSVVDKGPPADSDEVSIAPLFSVHMNKKIKSSHCKVNLQS